MYDDANGAYRTIEYEYTYGDIIQGENPAALYEMLAGGRTFTYEYDGLGRLVKKALSVGSGVDETYTYVTNGDNTTTLVETHKDMNGVTHTYTYDGNGNITQEIFGSVTRTYKYDKYNRLERYDDSGLGYTYLYYYDGRGNITSQAKYAYTTDSTENVKDLTPIETKSYAYGYDIWADALTNFNGSSITYDYAMNPTSWTKGRTLSWENEKSLASITDGTNTSTYTYNGDRLRTKKVTGSKTTEYYILDGTYVGEKTTVNGNTYRISYVYDENGAPTGLNIDGSACYFVKNLQGDVIALMGSDGGVFATYSYDAWGNIISIKDAYGAEVTNPGNYALLNPFRYRGYMYDDETGFYYLRARYYDPAVCRFLNPDDSSSLFISSSIAADKNLFSYCDDNPITRVDSNGTIWETIFDIASLVVSVAEVVQDPDDVGAWVSLAADTIDLIPFVTGVGETVRALKIADNVIDTIDAVDDVSDSAKAVAKVGESLAGGLEDTVKVSAKNAENFADSVRVGGSACFIAGTLVATENGNIPIEEISIGTYVYAHNTETGKTALKQVVNTFVRESYELIHLSINGEKITTTPEHPFWVHQKGWTTAVNLRAGDMLQLLNGEYVILEVIQHELLEKTVTVYNFEVEDYHTYYVTNSKILVHNSCSNIGGRHGGLAHRSKIESVKDSLSKKGWSVSSKESRVYLDNGKYRYPDIIAKKNGRTRFYQIGRATLSGKPVARELRALRDLSGYADEIFFIPYN